MNRRYVAPSDFKRRTHTLVLAVALLSAVAGVGMVRAQGQDKHSDMQKMPGMDMGNKKQPPTKASPSPTPTPEGGQSMQGQMGGMGDTKSTGGMDMKTGGGMTDMGPMLTMGADGDMGVKIGSSDTHYTPMGQMGSGTSWQPASTPMWMFHKAAGDWLLMLHGEAKFGLNSQGGERGVTKFESLNWMMPMAYHKLGKGTVQLRGMFSLEPLTLAPGGTPELFQTGETYKGRPLIDRQHPHDLFMELSAQYTLPVGERGSFFAYYGHPGEPALGPVAFMHRASASENPNAPLGHHLQDSTHISFGVLTTGVTYRKFKFEGSLFNGREPDENRYRLEFHPFTSQSVRLSFAPNRNWSMQVSYGHLAHTENQEPGDQRRTTASVSYNKPFDRGNWATSLIWGRNHYYKGALKGNGNSYLAESTVNFLDRNYVYARLELVDKNELLDANERARLGIRDEHPSFRIGAYTLGYVRDVWRPRNFLVGVGGDATLYSKPSSLEQIYGRNPASYKIFLRVRPRRMTMESMHGGAHGARGRP